MKLRDLINEAGGEKLPNNTTVKAIAQKEVDTFIKNLFKKYPELLNPKTPKDKRKVQDNFAEVIYSEIRRRIVAHINTASVERYQTPKEKEKWDKESAQYYDTHDKYGNPNYDYKGYPK